MNMKDVFIIDGLRTPFIKVKGNPFTLSAADLATNLGKDLVSKFDSNILENIEQVVLGCVVPDSTEANIARIVALRMGCKENTVAYTVQRNCASGLQAVDSAAKDIAINRHDLILAGGTEVMSRAPLLYSDEFTNWLANFYKASSILDKIFLLTKLKVKYLMPIFSLIKGLKDPVVGLSMGQTAEKLSYQYEISRSEMDEYSVRSHKNASIASENNIFKEEISPLFDLSGNVYQNDDGVRKNTNLEKLSQLKAVFDKPFGNVTAGNSSQLTDGAALLLLGSKDAVIKYKLSAKAKILDIAWSALDPSIMGLGPALAIEKLLSKNKLTFTDIDILEINEAFAGQVLACKKYFENLDLISEYGELNIDKLNPNGGAIALGHPIGASGARLVLHVTNYLVKNNLRYGIASLCIGGGQGGAILIERAGDN